MQKFAVAYFFSEEAQTAIAKARAVKEEYFEQFPQIEDFIKNCIKVAKRRGWVKTWTGRRRHFKKPKEEGYKGPNSIIQGGCGDITKTKMYEIMVYLKAGGYKSRTVNNIHDALLFEIHKEELFLIPILKAMMQDLPFSVPITCGVEMSETSWAELHEMEEAA